MEKFDEIDLGNPPAGFALKSAKKGELVQLVYREFISTEDGQYFIHRLEGLANSILERMPSQIKPSQVDHMLVIYNSDGKATVCVNKLEVRALAQVTRSVQAGENVYKDDLSGIKSFDIGVSIPIDSGFLFLFSVGWRKGLFYDFGPICGPDAEVRKYDINSVLAQAYCHVLFQERFSVTDAEWASLFSSQWFLFLGLRDSTINTLISYIRSGMDPDEKLNDIVSEVKERVPQMLNSWCKHSAFLPHMEILERAIDRFQDDDHISCTGLLFPRIEGILRTHHSCLGIQKSPSAKNLTESAVADKIQTEISLLLPHRFDDYLRSVYFKNFDPNSRDIDVSRHSVSHGVATASKFDKKSAVIGILIIHQLFYFLENTQQQKSQEVEREGNMVCF